MHVTFCEDSQNRAGYKGNSSYVVDMPSSTVDTVQDPPNIVDRPVDLSDSVIFAIQP